MRVCSSDVCLPDLFVLSISLRCERLSWAADGFVIPGLFKLSY